MKRTISRIISLLLALIVCFALVPAAFADETPASDRFLAIDAANFPDYYFRCWIIETLSVSGNEDTGYYMTEAQANAVTAIDFEKSGTSWTGGIADLTGVTLFPALKTLKIRGTKIEALDLSGCKTLESLDCELGFGKKDYITSIDVSGCTALTSLICSENRVTELKVTGCTALKTLKCTHHFLTSLDLTSCPALETLRLGGYYMGRERGLLTALDLSANGNLREADLGYNQLQSLDVSHNTQLVWLDCSRNFIGALDVSQNTALEHLNCKVNELRALDVSANTELTYLDARTNHLTEIDLDANTKLDRLNVSLGGQTVEADVLTEGGYYTFNLKDLVRHKFHRVEVPDNANYTLDPETGMVRMSELVPEITYRYKNAYSETNSLARMDVTVRLQFHVNAKVVWNEDDVQFKGGTAYVIANGRMKTPGFTVVDENGAVVDSKYYTHDYVENRNAGTGYVLVTFRNGYVGTCRGAFKIYLPATKETTVENVSDGIRLTWAPVEGAAGYVIYRRAWSTTTNGWTDFVRWNNTTGMTWTDKTVYAGTRYQYGVKAYFARRTDPVTGASIGGNVSDNFNLGIVGPLKTTVRITTRELRSVTAGTNQLTVKWTGSANFTGYQIQYATDKAFKQNATAVKITNPKTVQTVLKNLKSGTTYYVRVRSYHEFNGMTYFGGWSNVLSGKAK
jgi:hypothetical protein